MVSYVWSHQPATEVWNQGKPKQQHLPITWKKKKSFIKYLSWTIKSLNVKVVCTSMHFMSTWEKAFTKGCWTLTATVVPSINVALCTWAREAVPRGTSSMCLNIVDGC